MVPVDMLNSLRVAQSKSSARLQVQVMHHVLVMLALSLCCHATRVQTSMLPLDATCIKDLVIL